MDQPRMNLGAFLCCRGALLADMTQLYSLDCLVLPMWSPTMGSGCLSQCFCCHSQGKAGPLFFHTSNIKIEKLKLLQSFEQSRSKEACRLQKAHKLADRDIATNLT
ncbi:hypothetical protein CRYUN_Cryun19dG0068500 [Craigia yunnanensis]